MIAFGLAMIPVTFMAGAAIDYGRATLLRSSLQKAADAGALAAGARTSLTQLAREQIAKNAVLANLGAKARNLSLTIIETEPSAGVFQVQIQASIATSIMKVARFDTIPVVVTSEARVVGGSTNPIEIALALDNTGSMRDDMPALKQAAKTLAQNVMSGSGGNVKVSVVPYVAAVNPGLTDLTQVDTAAVAPATGNWFMYGWLGYDKNCTPSWGPGGGTGPGSGSSGDTTGDARDLIQLLDPFRRIARELFGVGSAYAADVTPNTVPPLLLQVLKSNVTWRLFSAPMGFGIQPKSSSTAGCDWVTNPGVVSNYELFKRLRDSSGNVVRWKGCVEARANAVEVAAANAAFGRSYTTGVDYDVTETPPAAGDPASLFVPYFWPDEPDYLPSTGAYAAPGPYVSGSGRFHNNYLADFTVPILWNWVANPWNNGQSILKYDGSTRAAIISETSPETYGPNASCPEPLTRLTNNLSTVTAAIDSMNYWLNGGTVISEGLMWAWRTLSPQKPYADGAAYTDKKTKKVIVLMTDGVNGLADNGNAASANISDYSAYGYMGASRLSVADGVTTYAGLQTFLDDRLKKACDNAKAKGISIYTVMFNHNGFLSATEQARSATLLSYCASKPEYAFLATDSAALNSAFGQIASSAAASPLRLTR
ncbi:pilus assembly protein TadG-related protein [Methylocystis sp. WRRC1]|uniref:pilus assembly protein TadG-related protein n=1 Tax=Methylocystis sp. WRRC1 TaxID=1732014 RepID=UPI001D15A441|nr:pilus assembly protein TadG-related protein [Methylocystis sp. WRRC1]MCC3244147.1 pilus assembly protein TadG-related protein [Methylocystis sp. WRRC1]